MSNEHLSQKPVAGETDSLGPASQQDQAFEQSLKDWHRQSRRQHPLSPAAKAQLQQLVQRSEPPMRRWQRRLTEATALAAAVGLIWFWQQGEQLWYRIDQQQQGLYQVQVHRLTTQAGSEAAESSASPQLTRQALYQAAYQDYLKSQQNHTQTVARLYKRQSTADGWLLVGCTPFQLQLKPDLLAALRQESHNPQLWQQLDQSRYVQVRQGEQGQILSLQPSAEALQCAP